MSEHTTDPSTSGDVITVERVIPSPPGPIFDLLADPARHHDIDGSGTVRKASGGSQRLGLGATFGMSMKWGVPYSMVNEVVEFEEDRRIAWQPRPSIGFLKRFIGGRIWRYELEPVDGGTLVKETWDIRQEVHKSSVRPLAGKTRQSMEQTLARIEQVVAGH
jgi:Polyketide cyclase / dehydrase and lipid transport